MMTVAAISLSVLGYGAKVGWGINWYGLSNPSTNSLGACTPYSNEDPICFIQSRSHKKKLFVIGDSQAESTAKPFMVFAKQNDWDFFFFFDAGSTYLDARCRNNHDCVDSRTKSLLKIKPDFVVISNLWNRQDSPDNAESELKQKLFLPLQSYPELKATKFVFVAPIPIVSKFNSKFTYVNRYILKNWKFNPDVNGYQTEIRKIFKEEFGSNINISTIDAYKKICSTVPCNLLNNGISLYRDSSHLTPQGAFYAMGDLSFLK
jgi:hypothetical protein